MSDALSDALRSGDALPLQPTGAAEPVRTVDSQSLFDGQRELLIAHKGDAYRLRITRQDKLILTK